jgi:hypothetical protein
MVRSRAAIAPSHLTASGCCYDSNRDGADRVYIEPVAGGPARALTPPQMRAGDPSWTREGIFFSSSLTAGGAFDGAFIIPTDGGSPRPLPPNIRMLKDCGQGVILTEDHRLLLRTGADERVAYEDASSFLRSAECNHAGTLIAFIQENRRSDSLMVVPTSGGTPRSLAEGGGLANPRFTPGGRSIVYSDLSPGGGSFALWEVSLPAGEHRRIFGGNEHALNSVVTPDGRQLIFVSLWLAAPLYEAVPHGAPRRLTSAMDAWTPAGVTPDGLSLLALRSPSLIGGEDVPTEAVLLSLADRRQLLSFLAESALLTPDGASVVYTTKGADGSAALWIRRFAGGEPRKLRDFERLPTLHAIDQHGFVHLTVEGEPPIAARCDVRSGLLTQEAQPPVKAVRPAPTGGWLVAVISADADHQSLRIVPPGGAVDDADNETCCTTSRKFIVFAWADGRSFYYLDGKDVHRRWVDRRDEVTVVSADNPRMVVPSPDGAKIYFSREDTHSRRMVITNFGERPWR